MSDKYLSYQMHETDQDIYSTRRYDIFLFLK
jgi:hypothetical protein